MAATVSRPFAGPEKFNALLQQSKEKLTQHILFQQNIIHDLRFSMQTDTRELDSLKAEVDRSHAQIRWLEEQLEETRDTIRQLREENCAEWERYAEPAFFS
jgi:hypothetical protein